MRGKGGGGWDALWSGDCCGGGGGGGESVGGGGEGQWGEGRYGADGSRCTARGGWRDGEDRAAARGGVSAGWR